MNPDLLHRLVIAPVLAELNWPQPRERAVLLTAIAIQESKLKYRRQMPKGPARSYWQIEPPTALDCCGRSSVVQDFCIAMDQGYDTSDQAACAIAAGILRLHPGALPGVGDDRGAWLYYGASWRPRKFLDGTWGRGKPLPASWPKAYAEAMRVTGA